GHEREGLHDMATDLGDIDARAVSTFPIGDPEAGINVRVGRYGTYVEDAEANRANVPEDMAPDELTLEVAKQLLATPAGEERELGTDPATGHPIVAEPVAGEAEALAFRAAHSIAPDQPLILCLPGSRRSEVSRLGPRFDEAMIRLRDRMPEIRVVMPTVHGVSGLVRDMAKRWPTAPIVVENAEEKRAAFAAADLALAASGTVSLDLAANNVPMVIGYDVAPLSRLIIRMLLKTDTVTLVNLVSETRAVPEFLGSDCEPGAMSQALFCLLEHPEDRANQVAAMQLTMERLGRGGEAPGLRAARSVLGAISSAPRPR
ncbi:MAG TPA: topoisomerase C-terminal repeat-containing protein, partial [Paracoccus sp. (in: a-proteobacteria)]|nr:topoisomerase C-terminal repeat-containing protein [Paracoccus sp. (in: a-proteobacteria)]